MLRKAPYGTFIEGSVTPRAGPWGPFTGSTSRFTFSFGKSLKIKLKIPLLTVCTTKRASLHSCVGQCSCCTLHYSKYDSVPICLWAASGRGQQGHSVLVLLTCAFCTSQQRHHNLTHVSIEDMSFIRPLGKIEGYGKKNKNLETF